MDAKVAEENFDIRQPSETLDFSRFQEQGAGNGHCSGPQDGQSDLSSKNTQVKIDMRNIPRGDKNELL